MSDRPSNRPDSRTSPSEPPVKIKLRASYLRSSLKLVLCLLPVWFLVSYGFGILFRDWLDANAPKVGNAPFGFWMAQQGSIICFVLILVAYAIGMNRLDRKYKITDEL